jgi:uncharacterized protein YdhG (YjbR/CyaY superfamily)
MTLLILSSQKESGESYMWRCPKCSREFENEDHSHLCNETPNPIDVYIDAQAEEVQLLLHQVRNAIRTALPDTQERISWNMPTFWNGHNLLHFAAFKKHIGVYPGEKAIVYFADRLEEYKTSKGAI